MLIHKLLASLVAVCLVALAPAVAQDRARVSVSLTPQLEGGEVRRVDVLELVSGIRGAANEVLFTVPARITFVRGQDYQEGDISARDDFGPLPLTMAVTPDLPGQPFQMRTFAPIRATQGPISLRYSASVTDALSPRPRGPSYDLRGVDGGFGGAFATFLLLPTSAESVDFNLSWDLSALPQGARGVSVLGEGDVAAAMSQNSINILFFLGGRLQSYAPTGSQFRAYWIGSPPFDARGAAEWSASSYNALQTFFSDDPGTYTLLMRPYTRPRDGGGATRGGFMLEYGRGPRSDAARRIMFTHEMVHHFIGSLDGDPSYSAWFGEGLAEFYKIRLPLRAGLISLRDAASEISVMTNAYYTSPAVAMPMAEMGASRWSNPASQSIPYNRGFMYFTNLDAAVRAHSRGRRSLDDLVLAMLASRRAGAGYDEQTWRGLLRAELGDPGIADFERMLNGDLIVPPRDAFGPCFERRALNHARPVLGMSEDSFLVRPYRVTGLEAVSTAAAAGVLEGDEILSFSGVHERIAHSADNVRLDPIVRLRVRRGDQTLRLSFSTEGPVIDEYSWSLRRGARQGCAL